MSLRSAAEFLEGAAARHPEKVGLVAQGRRLSWAEVDRAAVGVAHALRAQGVRRGDRVVLYGDNSVDLAAGIFGALYADACFVVVSGMTRAEKLAYVLRDCGAAALLADAALAPHWVGACALLADAAPPVLVFGGLSTRGPDPAVALAREAGIARCAALDGLAAAAPDGRVPRAAIDLDLAMIIYTSGSTGEPKGAMLSHRNVDFASWSVTTLLANTADEVIFSTLPLAFNYGLYQWLMAARLGATLVLERGFTFPLQSLARAAAEGATGFPGVPTMFALLAELTDAAGPELPAMRYVTSTAAQLLPRHVAALGRFFPGARVFSMYGLTECKRVSWLPPDDLARKPDSVGLPIPGTEFWVEDAAGRRLGPDEPGELFVRGSHVMRGYWGKPELSARYLRPGPLPGEQVLATGDLCRIDAEGYLHFVARLDEVIKSRGEKVAPREVERAIERIEGVRECAVVPVPDAVLGSAIKAFVVLEEAWRGRYTERDIALRAGQFVEPYMVPKHVEFRDSLPKTDLGKILKKALVGSDG